MVQPKQANPTEKPARFHTTGPKHTYKSVTHISVTYTPPIRNVPPSHALAR